MVLILLDSVRWYSLLSPHSIFILFYVIPLYICQHLHFFLLSLPPSLCLLLNIFIFPFSSLYPLFFFSNYLVSFLVHHSLNWYQTWKEVFLLASRNTVVLVWMSPSLTPLLLFMFASSPLVLFHCTSSGQNGS